jgi:hypothetical protein
VLFRSGGGHGGQAPGTLYPAGVAGANNTGGGGGGSAVFTTSTAGAGGPGVVAIAYAYTRTTVNTPVYSSGSSTWLFSTATTRWFNMGESSQQYNFDPTLVEDQLTTATSYFSFPSGTTAQRPANPLPGFTRFNTDFGQMEYYNNSRAWVQIPNQNT